MKNNSHLHKIKKQIVYGIIFCSLLIGWAFNQNVLAQENVYEVNSQTVEVTIDAKGKTRIRVYYPIEAEYLNHLEIKIPIKDQNLLSYRVGVIEESQSINYFAETSSKVAGSYQMTQTPQEARVNIIYPVVNKTVEYVIEYELEQSVINYQDGAYFEGTWIPLIDTVNEKNSELELIISFAGSIEEEAIHYWIQGAKLEKYEVVNREGQTSLIMNLLVNQPSDISTPVSLHTFFPKSVTPNNTNIIDIKGRQSIEARETQIQQEIADQARRKNYQLLLRTILASLIPLVATIFLYRRYQSNKKYRKPQLVEKTDWGMVPEPIDMYLVNSIVYHQDPGPNELAATVLELGRKGYLKLLPVRMANRSHTTVRSGYTLAFRFIENRPKEALLSSPERYALQLLNIDIKGADVITLEEMIANIRRSKQIKKEYQDLWKKYTDAIEVKSVSADHLKAKNKNFSALFAISSIVLTILSAVGISYDLVNQQKSQWLLWVLLGISCMLIIQFILIFFLNKQRNQQNSTTQQQLIWNAYKEDLRTLDQIDLTQFSTIDQWEKILIYAVALDETTTIQQTFTHHFDMMDLDKVSTSQNADFYRVHGSVANILQPAINEWIELIDPKGKWLRRF